MDIKCDRMTISDQLCSLQSVNFSLDFKFQPVVDSFVYLIWQVSVKSLMTETKSDCEQI